MLINQELGIDSLKFIRLILEVEAGAGRKIFNVETIAAIKTVGDLDTLLQSN
jgi:acyl carrier protein